MKTKLIHIIRLVLGVFMIIIGFNKFFEFTEIPRPLGDGGLLMEIYIQSGFLKLVGVLEVLGGLGIVFNRLLLIALPIITAIMVNASIFHLLHDPSGMIPATICVCLCIILLMYHEKIRPIFLNMITK